MSIEQVVRHYIETRSIGMVDTRDAIRAIRTFMPNCPLDDRQLADLVARNAIKHGCAVAFE